MHFDFQIIEQPIFQSKYEEIGDDEASLRITICIISLRASFTHVGNNLVSKKMTRVSYYRSYSVSYEHTSSSKVHVGIIFKLIFTEGGRLLSCRKCNSFL